jgi:3-oxoadipate enol-lactonase
VKPLSLAHISDGPADAPVLVLGNSLGTTTALWEPQLDALAAHFRVLRWDFPGHGSSPSPGPGVTLTITDLATALAALLDELGIAQFSYCGVSFGGMVGMSLAAHSPSRVRRLALCSTAARLPSEPWYERAATVRNDGMASIAQRVISRWFTPGFAARQGALVERFTANFVAIDVPGYAACCEAIAEMDLVADLALIRAPTLVITAADDLAIPPEHGAAVSAGIAGSRLVGVDDAAHLATVERAEMITPLLVEHLVSD